MRYPPFGAGGGGCYVFDVTKPDDPSLRPEAGPRRKCAGPDGLIVISDFTTGFWAFKMDGFDGWNEHQWGMPNVSSAQDWDNGPDGAPKTQKVS